MSLFTYLRDVTVLSTNIDLSFPVKTNTALELFKNWWITCVQRVTNSFLQFLYGEQLWLTELSCNSASIKNPPVFKSFFPDISFIQEKKGGCRLTSLVLRKKYITFRHHYCGGYTLVTSAARH